MQKIMSIKGMNDILPEESYKWLWLESVLQKWLLSYGYENIRTPILEDTKLFTRSIGEVTDIVEKEMYTFTDRLNGDSLSLRPEGTASTLRAVIEHNLLYNTTCKLWYWGSMFRHERPQKGRYRQFNQLGVEALGYRGPEIDAEIILMANDLWQRLGIRDIELQINCLGNKVERAAHRASLIKYFEDNLASLDENAKNRLYKNPLRILDTKNPDLDGLVNNAPKLIDYLGNESLNFYINWKCALDKLNIKYTENPRLVRGLDYYNLSVFEWVSNALGAQSTVCAGGRYDSLIEDLGGKPNYAVGFAIGLERLLLILDSVNPLSKKSTCDIYIANFDYTTKIYSLQIAETLRQQKYNVIQNMEDSSLKSQLKKANNLFAKVVLIIGENEAKDKQVVIKYMEQELQESVSLNDMVYKLEEYFCEIKKED